MFVGARLRARRELMGTSVNRLGDRLGVSGRTVSRWESDEDAVVPHDVQAMFDVLWDQWLDRVNSVVDRIEAGEQVELRVYRSPLEVMKAHPGQDITWEESTAFVRAVELVSVASGLTAGVSWFPRERKEREHD